MLTKKELCQCLLLVGQQKYKKPMTEIDVYYANEIGVGVALAHLNMIKDPTLLNFITSDANSYLYKHTNGKKLTYSELLNILPENEVIKPKVEKTNNLDVGPEGLTETQIKEILGERKYYKLLDAFDSLEADELGVALNLIKNKLLTFFT